MDKKTFLLGLIAGLLGVLFIVLFFWSPSQKPMRQSSVPLELKSSPKGGDFTVEILNRDLSLEDLRGKVVILYFGYTQCPVICPTSLAQIAKALKRMSVEELASVQVLFVSIDPERDNTARLEEYGQYFHQSILSASAEPDVIEAIADQYGVNIEFVDSDMPGGYFIEHSSVIYFIDQNGLLVSTQPFGVSSHEILESVRAIIKP